VVIPDYTLTPAKPKPKYRMADFISQTIDDRGAENVSVPRRLRRRRRGPARRPGVGTAGFDDAGTSRPAGAVARRVDERPTQRDIGDPLLDVVNSSRNGKMWAGDLDTRDPAANPMFRFLDG
jgi:hypothetical protein